MRWCARLRCGQGFKSWASQIKHRVAKGSPPLRLFFERGCVALLQCFGKGPSKLDTCLGVIQRVWWRFDFFWVDSFTEQWACYTSYHYANKKLNHCSTHKITKNIVSKMSNIFVWKVSNYGVEYRYCRYFFNKVTAKVSSLLLKYQEPTSAPVLL